MNADASYNLRTIIQNELVARCRRNARYSLRTFAKSLGVSPAALSEMLNGKRPITSRSIEKIGLSLGLSLEEIRMLKQNREGGSDQRKFTQISLDTFSYISDWYHDAILELMKVKGFKPDAQWIAKRLGLTGSEVKVAVERLIRLGIIVSQKDGTWQDQTHGFSSSLQPGLTSEAAKRHQQQITLKSYDAIGAVPIDLRDHTGMTMAIDPKDLPQARRLIKRFRRELSEFLERKTSEKKEVYQVVIGVFPLARMDQS